MPIETPLGYYPLNDSRLRDYLATLPEIASRLGGKPADWVVSEVGDGNLNLVFLIEGPQGGLCVKQALPYVRLVGEGWPMTLQRAFFEHEYMRRMAPHAGAMMPRLYRYEPKLFAIVMERLSPHIIMRRGMIAGQRYPAFAGQITDFLAKSLFFTSDLAMPAGDKKAMTAVFAGNTELCKITEDLIFTEPYMVAERNRWTTPQLDGFADAYTIDKELTVAISRLKWKFLTAAEALIHGDLHTGSVMVTEGDMRVIDAEFSFVGPMGFDTGAVLGNLLLSYFSQAGHASAADPREEYAAWILKTLEQVWNGFAAKFLDLWRKQAAGDAYPKALYAYPAGEEALEAERQAFMIRLYRDTLGFAGAKMIRRILGLAHVIDLEHIKDPDLRGSCEKRALRLARELVVNTDSYPRISDVSDLARTLNFT
jgi:5-methylthioribose kinase